MAAKRKHDIRPIRNDADHAAAVDEIAELWGAAEGTADSDRLDVLATLVDAYEAKRWPIEAPTPIAAIEFRLEQQGLTRKDLEPFIGSRARVSEIMNGKRPLTLPMIQRLSDGLGIPADVLIQPAGRLDQAGHVELAANYFVATQTAAKMRRDCVKTQAEKTAAHHLVAVAVRNAIADLGGTIPEDLPIMDHAKNVSRRLRKKSPAK
jgi:HTH-type transcriptional regulator / antitoxin HigA